FGQFSEVAAGNILFVGVIAFQDGEPLQFGLGLGQRKDGGITGRDRLHLGIGKLLATDVIGAGNAACAVYHLGDETCLGLQSLPHVRVKALFRDVAIDGNLFVLI